MWCRLTQIGKWRDDHIGPEEARCLSTSSITIHSPPLHLSTPLSCSSITILRRRCRWLRFSVTTARRAVPTTERPATQWFPLVPTTTWACQWYHPPRQWYHPPQGPPATHHTGLRLERGQKLGDLVVHQVAIRFGCNQRTLPPGASGSEV